MLSHYGVAVGLRCARKHFGWRTARWPEGAALRSALVRLDDPAEALAMLASYRDRSAGLSPLKAAA